ncbi:hypothetical protein AN641_01985 [Candidatus Epulonipiscioides gigas]|nr:hypothetical protein AN641_01985 [Epulopiscium sp. SCG-C07WGA-EpuloA2]
MDKRLKSALKQNFTPPAPQKRDKFVNNISYPKAKFSSVFLSQIGFIRKRVWVVFALCVYFAFWYVNIAEITNHTISVISAISPLFILCVTSEIYRSTTYNMDELELTCKYNLSKITLMRLCILGVINFIMLLVFIILTRNNDYGVLLSAIYLAVPFLLSSYLSLLIISKIHLKENIYICAGVCSSISIFMLNGTYSFIYNMEYIYLWVIAFFTLSLLLMHCFIRFIKLQEELTWNLS